MLGGGVMEHETACGKALLIHLQNPDMTVAPIGEEVGTVQADELAATVDMTADDADAFRAQAAVAVHGISHHSAGDERLRMEGGLKRAFAVTPAVVGTGFDEIDLLPQV